MVKKAPRYFEKPDEDETPLSLWQVFCSVFSAHLGGHSKEIRERDFRRGSGLQFFIVGIIYFLFIIGGLIVMINYWVL